MFVRERDRERARALEQEREREREEWVIADVKTGLRMMVEHGIMEQQRRGASCLRSRPSWLTCGIARDRCSHAHVMQTSTLADMHICRGGGGDCVYGHA